MKKIVLLGAVCALAACGGKDDPKEAMRQAIDEASDLNRICVPYRIQTEQAAPGAAAVVLGAPEIKLLKRDDEGKRVNQEAFKQLEGLVKAGIYEEGKEQKSEEGESVRTVSFKLSEAGKERVRIGHHGSLLCVGGTKVKDIRYFTEPTPHRGYTVSQVGYTAQIVPEKWAKPLVKNDKLLADFSKDIERQATLVKTNNGWRDIRELD